MRALSFHEPGGQRLRFVDASGSCQLAGIAFESMA